MVQCLKGKTEEEILDTSKKMVSVLRGCPQNLSAKGPSLSPMKWETQSSQQCAIPALELLLQYWNQDGTRLQIISKQGTGTGGKSRMEVWGLDWESGGIES